MKTLFTKEELLDILDISKLETESGMYDISLLLLNLDIISDNIELDNKKVLDNIDDSVIIKHIISNNLTDDVLDVIDDRDIIQYIFDNDLSDDILDSINTK